MIQKVDGVPRIDRGVALPLSPADAACHPSSGRGKHQVEGETSILVGDATISKVVSTIPKGGQTVQEGVQHKRGCVG